MSRKLAAVLFVLMLAGIGAGCSTAGSTSSGMIPNDYHLDYPLDEVYEAYFPIGAAVAAGEYGSDLFTTSFSSDLLGVFNSLTAENAMKPEVIHPKNTAEGYEFAPADAIVSYARENDMLVRGHTLVWHTQTPAWMTAGSREEARAILQEHITTIVDRYKDDIYTWDVVNEAVGDHGYRKDSPWFKAYGDESYITDAFDFAHAADPDCKLFYNDYGIVANKTKRQAVVDMIHDLDLIESHSLSGIGIQGHWNLTSPTADEIQETIDTFAELGLEVQITELDIDVFGRGDHPWGESYTPELETRLRARYEAFFEVFRANANVITGVTFWGISDDLTWLNHFWSDEWHADEYRQNYPLLFDTSHNPKAAYVAITVF